MKVDENIKGVNMCSLKATLNVIESVKQKEFFSKHRPVYRVGLRYGEMVSEQMEFSRIRNDCYS
jgi:hypothetical protein